MNREPAKPTQLGERSARGAIDLSSPLHLHVVGVGGAGMSAIALVAAGMGHTVSGSDLKESRVMHLLRAAGVHVSVGHAAGNVLGADAVTISSAIRQENPEVVEANRLGIPVYSRADVLSAIARTRLAIAVAGTHGKTTTSSMLALMLVEAGLQPSFMIGGELNEVGTGAVWDAGAWLVLEADESDGTFLRLDHEIAIVTSVEPDHIAHYGSFASLRAAFAEFLRAAERFKVVCVDDPVACELAAGSDALTYGTDRSAEYVLDALQLKKSSTTFDLVHDSAVVAEVSLPVPGLHNARNAAGALVTCLEMGVDPEPACRALSRFAGVARRFEFRGGARGVSFVDDYAHLPSEVRAALATARLAEPERVICVFQPHRYSRTADLWRELGDAVAGADVVVVTDVHPAGEMPVPGISGKLVADAAALAEPAKQVIYAATREELAPLVSTLLLPGDLCLTLGAGDLTYLPDELIAVLEAK